MENIKLSVTGSRIEVAERPEVITAGTVGLQVEFAFDSQWDGLSKTVIFRAGDRVIAAALEENCRTVPWETLESANVWLCIGVYGANEDGTVVIPTLWAKVAAIYTGVDPEGDTSLEPENPVWQEALARVANMEPMLNDHINNVGVENPHGVTCAQILAVHADELEEQVLRIIENVGIDAHLENEDNPHGVTCGQISAVRADELEERVLSILESVGVDAHLENEDNPHNVTCERIGAVAAETYEAFSSDATAHLESIDNNVASFIADGDETRDNLFAHSRDYANPHGVTAEQIGAAPKAVIVTVDGTTPSHTNAQIYETVINGGSVYLKMWNSTYIRLSWCTDTAAYFEASVITSITGADGNSYAQQRFRLYGIENDAYKATSVLSPSQAYVDAMIQYYLNPTQEE